jgi:pyruvate dehydrogenase E1 component alpha subunit
MLDDRLRVDMYAWMALTRAFDDTMVAMWKSGRGLGGTFSQRGHEGISVGVGLAMQPDDVGTPMHRDLGTYLVRGMSPERIFGNLLGRATGPTRGRDANLHGMGDLSLGIVGFVSHIPQALPTALGIAMSFRYRELPHACVTFVGDGGTTAGPFHEVLNMAALWSAPLVMVVENNQYAYSTPLDQQMASTDFCARAVANGVRAERVDGNDIESVYDAACQAFERARSGEGPTLIQADTMRMLGHAIHDGADYVPEELLEAWKRRDPLIIQSRRLVDEGIATATQLEEIVRSAEERVAEAVAAAEAAPFPDPATLWDGVFA